MSEPTPKADFVYEPLPPDHIRLISVWGLPIPMGHIPNFEPDTIHCRFEVHHIDSLPAFDAISYAWGTGDATETIQCQGDRWNTAGPARVSLHLWKGLATMMRKAPSILCWLDALSINQGDVEEKQQQIPLMTKIYSLATNVVVWLGVPEYPLDLSVINEETLLTVMMLLSMLPPGQMIPADVIVDPSWQAIAAALKRFNLMPWFRRSWVCQEAILAQNLVLLYGQNRLSWDLVYELSIVRFERSFDIIMMAEISDNDPNNHEGRFNSLGSINELRSARRRGRRPIRTDRLVNLIRSTSVSNLADKVYCILGLLQPSIAQEIIVDYSKSYEHIWLNFARAAITRDSTLSLLADTSVWAEGIPSWCPNLGRAPPDIFSFMSFEYHAGTHDLDHCVNRATLLPGGMHISVPGFRLGVIQDVAPMRPDFGLPSETQLISALASTMEEVTPWLNTVDALISRAMTVRGSSAAEVKDATWRVHIADAAYAHYTWDPDEPDDLRVVFDEASYPACDVLGQAYETWSRVTRSGCMAAIFRNANPSPQEIEQTMLGENFTQQDLRMFEIYNTEYRNFGRRRIFSTGKGLVGMGPTDIREGDVAVVLYDAGPIFILRPIVGTGDAEGKECFRSVGDGYVYGCMTLAKTSEEFKRNEENFIIG